MSRAGSQRSAPRGGARGTVASVILAGVGLMAAACGSSSPSTAGPAAPPAVRAVYVALGARPGATGTSCGSARYGAIALGIAAARANETVVVCPGTYTGTVVVAKPVVLSGRHATIDASGQDTGITMPVSGATVEGFKVENAIGEGILAAGKQGVPVTHVHIVDNVVEGNDTGAGRAPAYGSYAECKPLGKVPGDCGDGIHLMVVAESKVVGNTVKSNTGGILLTDEAGPTDNNMIEENTVMDNPDDGGVTLAGLNPKAFANGSPDAAAAGVFANRIVANTIEGNGVKGQGGGVILATPVPGGAVYGNTVEDNTMSGNGLAGVVMHAHAPNEDLNGNIITGNTVGTNNLAGDMGFSPHVDKVTTGIVVATQSSPIAVTITNNRISGDVDGIWTTGPVTVTGAATNTDKHVTKETASG